MKALLKSIGYLLYYMFFQMLLMMIFSMAVSVSGKIVSETEMMNLIVNNMLLITIISNLLSVSILVVFFQIRKKSFIKEIELVKINGTKYIFPILCTFCFSMFFSLCTYNMQFDNAAQIAQSAAYYSQMAQGLGSVMKVIALLICAPLAEEVICRGIMITRLKSSFSDVTAIAISAVLFGLMHFLAGGGMLVIGAAVIGMLCGIIFVKTKSLLPAIAAHVFANLPDFILLWLPDMSEILCYILMVLFLGVSIVGIIGVCRKSESRKDKV